MKRKTVAFSIALIVMLGFVASLKLKERKGESLPLEGLGEPQPSQSSRIITNGEHGALKTNETNEAEEGLIHTTPFEWQEGRIDLKKGGWVVSDDWGFDRKTKIDVQSFLDDIWDAYVNLDIERVQIQRDEFGNVRELSIAALPSEKETELRERFADRIKAFGGSPEFLETAEEKFGELTGSFGSENRRLRFGKRELVGFSDEEKKALAKKGITEIVTVSEFWGNEQVSARGFVSSGVPDKIGWRHLFALSE